jgi:tetratricopeptide (TPR) repeat protein
MATKNPSKVRQALTRAVALQRAGQLQSAQAICGKILAGDPGNGVALHLQGVLATQLGQFDHAIASFDLAIQVSPLSAALYSNRGIAYQKLDRFTDAISDFENAIAIQPLHFEAHNNIGSAMMKLDRTEAAVHSFERAIAIRPDFALAHSNLGTAMHVLGRTTEALACFANALTIEPDRFEAVEGQAKALIQLERWESAIPVLERVNLLSPNSLGATNDLGVAYLKCGEYEKAATWFQKSLELDGSFRDALFNLGITYYLQCRFEESLSLIDQSISQRGDAAAFDQRALILQASGNLPAALADYEQALAISPEEEQIRFHHAMALLQCGDYRNGWEVSEWRWRTKQLRARRRDFLQPLWLGQEPLPGQTILLHAEQGLGDTLQFCRFIPLVANLGAEVVFEVHESLYRLMQDSFPEVRVVLAGKPLPDFDFHCPLMSLPLAFATELETIPRQVPYLLANPMRVKQWADQIGPRRRRRIGLVWSSGVRPHLDPQLQRTNERRDIPLSYLAPLRAEAADFYSLQKGEPAATEFRRQVAAGWDGPPINDLTERLSDFAETAALIANLDLVIAVDTSTAHLAGAMGKPVSILLRFDACWRWLLNRPDSPWYPSATLYRQPKPGAWEAVINQVRSDLREQAADFMDLELR